MSNTINLAYHRRVLLSISSLRGRGRNEGAGNDCFKPSSPQSKQDLEDLHKDEMRERKRRQARGINVRGPWYWKKTKNQDSEYRKSIWPKTRIAKPGRMG